MTIENRWKDQVGNGWCQDIMDLSPAHAPLRLVVAKELARRQAGFGFVVDLGAGVAYSVLQIMRFIDCPIVLVDSDQSALEQAEERLRDYDDYWELGDLGQIQYVETNLFNFLEQPLDERLSVPAVTASWTIHNFPPQQQVQAFLAISDFLRRNGGKYFVLMDKILPDGIVEEKKAQQQQLALYQYLPESVRERLLAHEQQDWGRRMREREFVSVLETRGFKVTVGPRVMRDLVLICELAN
jgi:ubiquinone/menaquinone biosynthesis C-methylase UbiE